MNTKRIQKPSSGFTLIEILVVIGLIAILAAAVLVAINPIRQFQQARDSQRQTHISAILNAVGQNLADNKGIFTCAAGSLPAAATVIKSAAGGYNLAPCIEATYISQTPIDPKTGSYTDITNYDTTYTIMQDAGTKRITISATGEITNPISATR